MLEEVLPTSMVPLKPGTPVFDVTGDRLGSITAHDPESAVFTMQRGIFFSRTLILSLDLVAIVEENAVHLSLPRDRILMSAWEDTQQIDVTVNSEG